MIPGSSFQAPVANAARPREDGKQPPQPAAGPAPRPWAGRQVQALPEGPVIGVPRPEDTPEGFQVYVGLGASLLGVGVLLGTVAALRHQGYLEDRLETPVALAIGLVMLTLLVRSGRQLQALAQEEPRLVEAAGLTRKAQMERVVQRANRQGLTEEATRDAIEALRTAAALQAEDEPGNDQHIAGMDLAEALARLGHGAALNLGMLVPRRVALLREAVMALLAEGRIDARECARALALLAAAVAARLKESTDLGRPPSDLTVVRVASELAAPFLPGTPHPLPAWNALPPARARRCLMDIFQLPVLEKALGHVIGPTLAARPVDGLAECFDLLRRYTGRHVVMAFITLLGLDRLAYGQDRAKLQSLLERAIERPARHPRRLFDDVLALVARHPQRMDISAVDYLAAMLAKRGRPDLGVADRAAARAQLARLGELLAPRMDARLREALTLPWVRVLREGGASDTLIAAELLEVLQPASAQEAKAGQAQGRGDGKASSSRSTGAGPRPAPARQPAPPPTPPALAQAIAQARDEAWARRGDHKGLNLQEMAALEARITQMEKAAAAPAKRGT